MRGCLRNVQSISPHARTPRTAPMRAPVYDRNVVPECSTVAHACRAHPTYSRRCFGVDISCSLRMGHCAKSRWERNVSQTRAESSSVIQPSCVLSGPHPCLQYRHGLMCFQPVDRPSSNAVAGKTRFSKRSCTFTATLGRSTHHNVPTTKQVKGSLLSPFLSKG